jgi:hemerythrin-like domain-containing protein
MELIDALRAEHDRIEQVAGSLRVYARRLARGEAPAQDAASFVRFFRLYAGRFHHGREEDVLFVALQREAELPGDRGPIAALLEDHRRMERLVDAMDALAGAEGPPAGAVAEFEALALEYSQRLLQHIDSENSVLLPESALRLHRCGVRELPGREETQEEAAAWAAGEALVAGYPPVHEPELMRGDGCVFCPAFATTCRGIEREWWNEWEWEEFEEHLGSD